MLKRTALTVSYYAISFTAIWLLNDISPSGPCTPGLGILAFMLMIPLSVILLFRNLYVTKKAGRANLPATFIHFTACILLIWPSLLPW